MEITIIRIDNKFLEMNVVKWYANDSRSFVCSFDTIPIRGVNDDNNRLTWNKKQSEA